MSDRTKEWRVRWKRERLREEARTCDTKCDAIRYARILRSPDYLCPLEYLHIEYRTVSPWTEEAGE